VLIVVLRVHCQISGECFHSVLQNSSTFICNLNSFTAYMTCYATEQNAATSNRDLRLTMKGLIMCVVTMMITDMLHKFTSRLI